MACAHPNLRPRLSLSRPGNCLKNALYACAGCGCARRRCTGALQRLVLCGGQRLVNASRHQSDLIVCRGRRGWEWVEWGGGRGKRSGRTSRGGEAGRSWILPVGIYDGLSALARAGPRGRASPEGAGRQRRRPGEEVCRAAGRGERASGGRASGEHPRATPPPGGAFGCEELVAVTARMEAVAVGGGEGRRVGLFFLLVAFLLFLRWCLIATSNWCVAHGDSPRPFASPQPFLHLLPVERGLSFGCYPIAAPTGHE